MPVWTRPMLNLALRSDFMFWVAQRIARGAAIRTTFEGTRYTAEHVPGARFVGYPTGGHLCVGYQDEVASAIAAFVFATT
jgi:hypothetical protein